MTEVLLKEIGLLSGFVTPEGTYANDGMFMELPTGPKGSLRPYHAYAPLHEIMLKETNTPEWDLLLVPPLEGVSMAVVDGINRALANHKGYFKGKEFEVMTNPATGNVFRHSSIAPNPNKDLSPDEPEMAEATAITLRRVSPKKDRK